MTTAKRHTKFSSEVSSIAIEEELRREPFPFDENVVFRESSFFNKPNAQLSLPTPTEVREVASRSGDPRAKRANRPPPVTFPNLGLLVKYGREVSLAEGQCLLFICNALCEVVPVPEVYGWCKDDDQLFIYMQLIDGVTLEKRWDAMIEEERTSVCRQLHDMVDALRGVKQDSLSPFIGMFNFVRLILKLRSLYSIIKPFVTCLPNSPTRSCWQATTVGHHFYKQSLSNRRAIRQRLYFPRLVHHRLWSKPECRR